MTSIMHLELGICADFNQLTASNRSIRAVVRPLSSQLLVYYAQTRANAAKDDGNFPQDQKISLVSWNTIPKERFEFIQVTSRIFLELNGNQESGERDRQDLLESKSLGYLKEILGHARNTLGSEAQLFSAIHGIWHLAHITAFERGPILEQFSSWIKLNICEGLQVDYAEVIKTAQPAMQILYWPLVHMCLLRGFFTAAVQLLEHSSFPELFSNLCDTYPKLNQFDTPAEFQKSWSKWSQDASFAASQESNVQFKDLYLILAGDESKIIEVSNIWQDIVSGLLHFVYPMDTIRNMHGLVTTIRDLKITTESDLLDQIYLALLEQDYGRTIITCSQFDWWLTTHLADLFEKGKLLNLSLLEIGTEESFGEWYVVNYAEHLLSSPALLRISLDYLITCTTVGHHMIEAIIPHMPITEIINLDILSFCRAHKLTSSTAYVLKVLGDNALSMKLYNEAIVHYLDADDLSKVSYVVTILLQAYVDDGDKTFTKVAKNLQSKSLFKSPALAFLSRYNEFQNLYDMADYKEAANLIVLLLTSGVAPKSFWKLILLDTIPLLEGQLCVFDAGQVFELMRFAEIIICDRSASLYNFIDKKDLVEDDSLDILKLALTRSLAASMIME